MHSNTLFVLGVTILVLGALATPSSAQLNIPLLDDKGASNGGQGGDSKNSGTPSSNGGSKPSLAVDIGGSSNNSADPPTSTASGSLLTTTSLVIVGPTGQRNLNPDGDNSAIAVVPSTILPIILSTSLSLGLLIASMAIIWT